MIDAISKESLEFCPYFSLRMVLVFVKGSVFDGSNPPSVVHNHIVARTAHSKEKYRITVNYETWS